MRKYAISKAGLRETLCDYINHYDWVSVTELRRRVDGVIGEWMAMIDKNIVVAVGISEEADDAIRELIDAGRIHMAPASWFVYFVDGGVPDLPTVKRIPKAGYKTPHWLPICFRPGPYPDEGYEDE